MENTMPQGTQPQPPFQHPPAGADDCHSDQQIVFALGVVLLIFGPAITGYHQASLVGLALIVFCSMVRF